ncbi:MAG: hypothetical protein ACFCU6_00465, partial [Balneolaceae bacterium]
MFFSLFMVAMLLLSHERDQAENTDRMAEGIISRLNRNLPDDVPPVKFKDITKEAGIDFKHFDHIRGSRIAEDMESGVAWVDYNNNGLQDLFLVNYSGPLDLSDEDLARSQAVSRLYRNNGNGT